MQSLSSNLQLFNVHFLSVSPHLTVTEFKRVESYHYLTPTISWLLLSSDFTSLTTSSLFSTSRSTKASLVSFLIASIQSCSWRSPGTWTVTASFQQIFKSTVRISACDHDTFSSSPKRGFIYFLFLIRWSIEDAYQNVTHTDLVFALKCPNGSSSILKHSSRLLTGQSTSPLPYLPDPF